MAYQHFPYRWICGNWMYVGFALLSVFHIDRRSTLKFDSNQRNSNRDRERFANSKAEENKYGKRGGPGRTENGVQ